MRRIFAGFLSIYAMFVWSFSAQASEQIKQDASEELLFMDIPMVVTASKKAESVDVAPNVMYVFTREEMQERGIRNLQDLFRVIPGFQVNQKDIQLVAAVRGVAPNDSEKVALMYDGHVLNQVTEPDFFQGGSFPLQTLDRVEVIVGPGGVFYGGETLCAVINLIPRKDQDKSELSLTGGNFNSKTATLSFGKKIDATKNFTFAANYYSHDGFPAWDKNDVTSSARSLSEQPKVTGEVFPSMVMMGHGQYDDWTLNFFSQNSNQPDLHLQSNGVTDGRRFDYIYSMGIKNEHAVNDNWSTSFSLYGDLKRTAREVVFLSPGESGTQNNWDLMDTQYWAEYAVQYKNDKNYLQAGYQYKDSQHRQNYQFEWMPNEPYMVPPNGDIPAYPLSIVKIIDTNANGVYVSEEYKVSDKLSLTGAARADEDTVLCTEAIYVSPRAAVVYQANKNWTLKLMENTATRMAQTPQGTNLNQIWGNQLPAALQAQAPSWAISNPNILKPEVLTTYELQSINYFGKTRFSVDYYHQKLDDFTAWFGPRCNVGNFEGDGVEVDMRTKASDSLTLLANGAYNKNHFTTTAVVRTVTASGGESSSAFQLPSNPNGDVNGVPAFTANVGCEWQPVKKLFVSPTVRYTTSEPMDFDGTTWTYADNRAYLDLTIMMRDAFVKDMDIRLSGYNITDNKQPISTQWLTDSYTPQGASVELTVSQKF